VNVTGFPKIKGLGSEDEMSVFEEIVSENVFEPQGLPVTMMLAKTPDTVGVPMIVVVVPGPAAMLNPAGNPVADQVADVPLVETLAL
jgi:hypothetical protein